MKKPTTPNAAAQAERLLEHFFRAGPAEFFIFDRLRGLPVTQALLDAPRDVTPEILLRLMALIACMSRSNRENAHADLAALARKLMPGLADWTGPDSKWLGSGAERVPVQLVPLLLRKTVACDDATFARLLEDCCAVRRPIDLLVLRGVVEAFVRQSVRRLRTDGVGNHSGKVLARLATKLAGLGKHEVSAFATWGRKQAARIREALDQAA